MTASMPWLQFQFGSQTPAAPPDRQSYSSLSQPPPLSPHLLKSFTQELYNSGLCNSLGSGFGGGLGGLGGLGGPASRNVSAMDAQMMMSRRAMMGGMASAAAKTAPPLRQKQEQKHQLQAEQKQAEQKQAGQKQAGQKQAGQKEKELKEQKEKEKEEEKEKETKEQQEPDIKTEPLQEPAPAPTTTAVPTLPPDNMASDPRYLAMASRIAAYYHQRCQAVAHFQQQRCQAWANMQRQKNQEMTQATMLVVAWYVRDRIQRRRRRQKRHFRRGLASRAAGPGRRDYREDREDLGNHGNPAQTARAGVTKGERVRKWVLQVPDAGGALSPNTTPGARDKPADPDEAAFDIDRDTVSDQDTRLYSVADNLIKSQLARIDVPMMGTISFDASETESDEEEEDFEEDDDDDDGNNNGKAARRAEIVVEERDGVAGGAARAGLGAAALYGTNTAKDGVKDDDYYMEDDDYEFEDDDDDEFESDEDVEEASREVHHGTGTGTGVSGSRPQTSTYS